MTQALVTRNQTLAVALPPTGNLDQYIQAAFSVPVLSAEQERSLALRLQGEGDLGAARDLVMSHLRFVIRIARGYSGYGLA
jgi:RNA polymerase sigma-32 factor